VSRACTLCHQKLIVSCAYFYSSSLGVRVSAIEICCIIQWRLLIYQLTACFVLNKWLYRCTRCGWQCVLLSLLWRIVFFFFLFFFSFLSWELPYINRQEGTLMHTTQYSWHLRTIQHHGVGLEKPLCAIRFKLDLQHCLNDEKTSQRHGAQLIYSKRVLPANPFST